jgi:hypothetical protein
VTDERFAEIDHWYAEWRYTTLYELNDGYLYEFDAPPAFFPWADADARAELTRRLLGELWRDGWATFMRRGADAPRALSDAEVEAVIEDRAWEPRPALGDAIDVIVRPTAKARAWQGRAFTGEFLPADPQRPRPE